jgi:hypothetical protein
MLEAFLYAQLLFQLLYCVAVGARRQRANLSPAATVAYSIQNTRKSVYDWQLRA